jgi:hypothetical protein
MYTVEWRYGKKFSALPREKGVRAFGIKQSIFRGDRLDKKRGQPGA